MLSGRTHPDDDTTLHALAPGDAADVLRFEQENRAYFEADRLPHGLRADLPTLTSASRRLRRDRELAFYGAEDLTPSDFYGREDAEAARAAARETVALVGPHLDDPP